MIEGKILYAFFELLRSGLWNSPINYSDNFPLSKQEWNTLYLLSINHTVDGIVFDGIQKLDHKLQPPKDILINWLVRTEKIEQRNDWMNNILLDQVDFFKSQGLTPILLKGQGLADFYINAKRRSSGDIDWYFGDDAAYLSAKNSLQKNNFKIQETPGFSASFFWENCETEIHQRMFDIHNPLIRHYFKKIEESESENKSSFVINNKKVFRPSPISNLVQINLHILKHLLSFGIGMRQLCDSARAYVSLDKKYDKKLLHSLYRKIGVLKWINLLHLILVDKFGLPEEMLPFELNRRAEYSWMLNDILHAGNFGFHNEEYKLAENKTGKRAESKTRIFSNLLKYIKVAPQEAISFPIVHFYSRFSS